MRHYATLCDRKFLPRALAMVESLKRHSSVPVVVHLLALDEQTKAAVNALGFDYLRAFYWPGPRKDHTWQEYCWLMASQWSERLLDLLVMKRMADEITYLDADLFFFGDPEAIHAEIGSRSIGIIPHRFIPSKKYLERNGTFNVGFVTFKGEAGRKCLAEWASQCREWCYNMNAPGRFGDQKYLEEFPAKYGDEVCIIQNIGVGLGPWNYANHRITEGPKADGAQAVFAHMHEFAELSPGKYRLTNYALRPEDKKFIYEPYIKAYESAKEMLESVTA